MAKIHPVPAEWADKAIITADIYADKYAQSVADPDAFWRGEMARLDWMKTPTKIKNTSFNEADFGIKWFEDGELNVSVNCLDRHLATRANDVAIIWEGDEPDQQRKITFAELHAEVCRMANVLKDLGAKKGDRITLYLPMIPEAAMAMLACTRIGAVHSIVFGGFSPDALAGRITDCDSNILITTDAGMRGGKVVPLKGNADAAMELSNAIQKMLVIRHVGNDVPMVEGRDVWYHEARETVAAECEPEVMNAETVPVASAWVNSAAWMVTGCAPTSWAMRLVFGL